MNPIDYIFKNPILTFEILFFSILFFFLIREGATWYWKINKAIRILERIERNTRKDGIRYPDEEFDEDYFKRNNIKIPGENVVLDKKD